MRRWVLALLACASCQRLLGLEQVDPPPPDGTDPSKDTGHVQGTYVQRWIEIAADSSTAVPRTRDYPASMLSGSVTLADGSTRALAITDGAFSFTTPAQGDPYSLQLLGQNGARTFDMTAATPQLVERLTYPPDRTLAPLGTTLILNVTQRHPEGSFTKEELVTLGTWTRHQVDAAGTVSVDCEMTDASGQVGLLVPHDTAYYTSTSLSSENTYFRIAYSAKVADVMTAPGMANTLPLLPLPAQPVVMDQCANILAHGVEESTREEALIPNALPMQSARAWYVLADPAPDFALVSGLPLALSAADGGAIDADYGNPYGLTSIDVMLATYAIDADGAVLASELAVPAAPSCATQVEILSGQVELPTHIAVDGTPLISDSQLVPVQPGKIALTWDGSPDGHADFYFVFVLRLVGGTLASVEQVVTYDHSVMLPAADFVAADTYQIQVTSELGYPNAARGDFATSSPTMGEATYTTPSFRITSP